MNPFKKIVLTLAFALAFFAGDAAANPICGGKTVYIQLPSNWGNNVYIYEGGRWHLLVGTTSGGWFTFTLPDNTQNYDSQTFTFVNISDEWNSSIWIGSTNYGGGQNPGDINCSVFGSSDVIYISANPSNPNRTLIETTPPNAYYFYFLPPNETEWILSTPYLMLKNGDKIRFQTDPDGCGWYRLIYFNEEPPSSEGVIYSSNEELPKDKIGLYGVDEEYEDWDDGPGPGSGNPTSFSLKDRFNALNSRTIFFAAQRGSAGWTTTDLRSVINEPARCSYSLAAILYKHAVGGSFSQYEGTSGGCTNGESNNQSIKGIVRSTLDDDRKMVLNTNRNSSGHIMGYRADDNSQVSSGWCSEKQFYDAFQFTSSYNIEVCYDMPFQRASNGNWEFDSDKLVNPAGYQVGGFFPHVLYGTYFTEATTRGYNECANCRVGGVIATSPRVNTGSIPSVTWRGETYTGIDAFDRTPAGTFTPSYSYDPRIMDGAPRPVDDKTPGVVSEKFNSTEGRNYICFESHAEFTYEGGEEFFFRGDDDIWVFINNRLVLDLGGNHEALPGYVDLDTIGGCTYVPTGSNNLSCASANNNRLVRGEKYNIDIFFCDRRGPNANVRISTNIYFEQKTGLSLSGPLGRGAEICLETSGGGGCASAMGTEIADKECGDAVAPKVEYYIQNRQGTWGSQYMSDDKDDYNKGEFLNAENPNCVATGTPNELRCYGGIVINTVLGTVTINTDNISGFTGTYIIYVRVKEEYAKVMSPEPSPLELARFSRGGTTSVVWGNAYRNDNNGIIRNFGTTSPTNAVASKLVPLGFAAGAWDNPSSPTSFQVNMDESPGATFTIASSSMSDVSSEGSELRVYECVDANGNDLATITDHRTDCVEIENPRSREFTVPASGLKVLWFTGSYEAESNATYAINVTGAGGDSRPPFNLIVWPPKIEFVKEDGTIIPQTNRVGSDPDRDGANINSARTMSVYIGTVQNRRIAAYDPTVTPNTLCTSCDFISDEILTRSGIILSGVETPRTNLINFSRKTLERGLGSFSFSGLIPVPESGIGDNDNGDRGYFTVSGLSTKAGTEARWDSLIFVEPPVPYPDYVKIYDKDGDGIGDSIRVVYNRKFPDCANVQATVHADCVTGILDSLPNKLEIIWSKDTLRFGLAQLNSDGNYDNKGFSLTENYNYWKNLIRQGDEKDTIVISLPFEGYTGFSEEIKTARHNTVGEEVVYSWSSFEDEFLPEAMVIDTYFERDIQDGIPPIVISARYTDEGTSNCGSASNLTCTEKIRIVLSEPVVAISEDIYVLPQKDESGNGPAFGNPFAYMLRSQGSSEYAVYYQGKNLPRTRTNGQLDITWGRTAQKPSDGGDSIVVLTYGSYYVAGSDSTQIPIANDSVRIAWDGLLGVNFAAIKDLAGNLPNPKEHGRRIEGENRFTTEQIRIATQDPSRDVLEDALNEMRENGPFKDIPDDIFKESPAGLLPAGDDWTKEQIEQYYPGSVGQLFRPDVASAINDLADKYGVSVEALIPGVTFHANAFYHTNLGDYVAKSNALSVKCDDPIFKVNGEGNCYTNGSKLYLAWNLKDNKKRWVGVGAYVEVYDFHWRIKYDEKGINETKDKQTKKVEMLGVKRGKAGSLRK